jgi:hypothetical protein
MIAAPAMAAAIPTTVQADIRSRRKSHEAAPTKSGVVETSRTELVTEVYFRELIQRAKWRARQTPEIAMPRLSRNVQDRISRHDRRRATGSRINAANDSRQAAMTRDGASHRRMSVAAHDDAQTPAKSAR